MNCIGDQIPMCNTIAPQFISYYFPGFVSMYFQEPFKESLCGRTISSFLEKHINNFTILINRSPEVMLFTINPDENLINEKCISISLVPSLQSGRIFWTKFNTPQSDRLVSDIYPSLSK